MAPYSSRLLPCAPEDPRCGAGCCPLVRPALPLVVLGLCLAWVSGLAHGGGGIQAAYTAATTGTSQAPLTVPRLRQQAVMARPVYIQSSIPPPAAIPVSVDERQAAAASSPAALGVLLMLSTALAFLLGWQRRPPAAPLSPLGPGPLSDGGAPADRLPDDRVGRRQAFGAALAAAALPAWGGAARAAAEEAPLAGALAAAPPPAAEPAPVPAPTPAPRGPVITDRVYFEVRISRPDNGDPEERPYSGRVVFGLYGQDAPLSVARFLEFATNDRLNYSSSSFFRMDPGLLLEGGRIDALEVTSLAGSPTLKFGDQVLPASMAALADESNELSHIRRGLLTHARAEPTGEFAITLAPDALLDDTHVVFGEVLEGQQFLDRVEFVPLLRDDEPGLLGDWVRAQKRGFRKLAELIGDDRVKRVYENKLLRRVNVALCGVVGAPQPAPTAVFAIGGRKTGRTACAPLRAAFGPPAAAGPPLEPGTAVRVCQPLTLYHVPKANGAPMQVEGCRGTLLENLATYKGATITPNYPCKVQLEVDVPGVGPQSFVCHLGRNEIEAA